MSPESARDAEAAAGPGALLRRAREAAGLSEQQAAERLNLDAGVVAALERDDLAALGAPVFAKGHMRRYGSLLGVAEDALLGAYAQLRAQPDAPSLIPRSRLEITPGRGRPKWPWVLGGVLAFMFAAGLAAYVSEHGVRLPAWPRAADGDSQQPASAPAGAADAAAPEGGEAADTAAAPPAGAAAGAAESAATTGPAPAPAVAPPIDAGTLPLPAGHVRVTLSFAADSWTEVYDGAGQAVLYDLGRAGSQRVVTAAAPLSVTLGNAPAVTIAINGRPTQSPAPPAGQTVARFSVQSDGSLR